MDNPCTRRGFFLIAGCVIPWVTVPFETKWQTAMIGGNREFHVINGWVLTDADLAVRVSPRDAI